MKLHSLFIALDIQTFIFRTEPSTYYKWTSTLFFVVYQKRFYRLWLSSSDRKHEVVYSLPGSVFSPLVVTRGKSVNGIKMVLGLLLHTNISSEMILMFDIFHTLWRPGGNSHGYYM